MLKLAATMIRMMKKMTNLSSFTALKRFSFTSIHVIVQ